MAENKKFAIEPDFSYVQCVIEVRIFTSVSPFSFKKATPGFHGCVGGSVFGRYGGSFTGEIFV